VVSMDDDAVLAVVEQVFPTSDGSTLVGQGEAGIKQIRPLLNFMSTTGCPAFTNSSLWTSGEVRYFLSFSSYVLSFLMKMIHDCENRTC
jgi:hypothetical protein